MKDEMNRLLYGRFPQLLEGSLHAEQGGIQCGDGWHAIIEALLAMLQKHAAQRDFPTLKVDQIKSKFGRLRVYYHPPDPFVDGAIALAEELSTRTCEESGAPGVLRIRNRWYKTLSDEIALRDGWTTVPPKT